MICVFYIFVKENVNINRFVHGVLVVTMWYWGKLVELVKSKLQWMNASRIRLPKFRIVSNDQPHPTSTSPLYQNCLQKERGGSFLLFLHSCRTLCHRAESNPREAMLKGSIVWGSRQNWPSIYGVYGQIWLKLTGSEFLTFKSGLVLHLALWGTW